MMEVKSIASLLSLALAAVVAPAAPTTLLALCGLDFSDASFFGDTHPRTSFLDGCGRIRLSARSERGLPVRLRRRDHNLKWQCAKFFRPLDFMVVAEPLTLTNGVASVAAGHLGATGST